MCKENFGIIGGFEVMAGDVFGDDSHKSYLRYKTPYVKIDEIPSGDLSPEDILLLKEEKILF